MGLFDTGKLKQFCRIVYVFILGVFPVISERRFRLTEDPLHSAFESTKDTNIVDADTKKNVIDDVDNTTEKSDPTKAHGSLYSSIESTDETNKVGVDSTNNIVANEDHPTDERDTTESLTSSKESSATRQFVHYLNRTTDSAAIVITKVSDVFDNPEDTISIEIDIIETTDKPTKHKTSPISMNTLDMSAYSIRHRTTVSDSSDNRAGANSEEIFMDNTKGDSVTTKYSTSPNSDNDYKADKPEHMTISKDMISGSSTSNKQSEHTESFPTTRYRTSENTIVSTDIYLHVTMNTQNATDLRHKDHNANHDMQATVDCNVLIVILSSVFVVVVLLVTAAALFGMWRLRKTWRRKLQEEKRKTDIWIMDTFNNTIVNENFLDFNDIEFQQQEHGALRQSESSSSITTSGTRRSSAAHSGMTSSVVSSGSSYHGQKGMISPKRVAQKVVGRPRSSYTTDAAKDPESRGRASTFTHGRRKKAGHDTHNLVDHIETEEEHSGILQSVDKILKPQNKHIVTEL